MFGQTTRKLVKIALLILYQTNLRTQKSNDHLITYLITNYGQISNSLQPKLISQTQIDFPLKCLKYDVSLKILVFCKNNKWSIENHGLVTQKYGLRFQLGKPPQISDNFFSPSAHLANYFGYF